MRTLVQAAQAESDALKARLAGAQQQLHQALGSSSATEMELRATKQELAELSLRLSSAERRAQGPHTEKSGVQLEVSALYFLLRACSALAASEATCNRGACACCSSEPMRDHQKRLLATSLFTGSKKLFQASMQHQSTMSQSHHIFLSSQL